jgi:putative glutamine amidotransferase
MRKRVLIGIVSTVLADEGKHPGLQVSTALLDAVNEAGGLGVTLHPRLGLVPQYLALVEGIVFAGGHDPALSLSGEEGCPAAVYARSCLELWEYAVYQEAKKRRYPVLGICRGMQQLNLWRDGRLGHITNHSHGPGTPGADSRLTTVTAVAGSPLADLMTQVEVPCNHHLVCDTLGAGLKPMALSDDGLVHALWDPRHRHFRGVQWHPEKDLGQGLSIFEALVDAAARRRRARRFLSVCLARRVARPESRRDTA